MPALQLHLKIRSREGLVYDSDIKALTGINKVGKFDILPEHTNFISLIDKQLQIHELDGRNTKIDVENGVLRVINGKIDVVLGVKLSEKTNFEPNAGIN